MTNSHFNSRDYNENPLDSSHSDVVRIAKGTKTDHSTLYEFNGTIVLDDPRLKSFLDNPDLEIYIHQDFINHIPKGSLANCYYFD